MIPNNPLTGETTGDFESRISALLQVSPEEAAQVLATARGMDTAQSTDFLMGLLGHSELALALITEISTSRHTEMGSWASKLTADQPMSPKQPDPQSAPLKSINSKKKNKNKKKLEKLVIVGDAATVNGRRICSCLATVHILSTNCLTCGKIICELEFSDDPLKCPFCTAGLDKTQQQVPYAAVERLNVLLDYDQTSAQRSRVIDVAGDYDRGVYDKWKTPEERAQAVKRLQELERQKEENRNKRVISLDIVSGKVTMQKVAPPAFEMARDSQCKNEAQAPLVKTGHARIKKQLVYPVTEHTDKGKRALHRRVWQEIGQSLEKAKPLLDQASKSGDVCASTLLGWLSPKPFDLKIARALFDEGVAKGFSPALYARGAIQEKYGAGAKWHARDAGYLEAARKGNVLAILAEWRITNFQ